MKKVYIFAPIRIGHIVAQIIATMNKRRGGNNSNRASSTNSVKVGGVALNSNSNSDNCSGAVADDEESNRLNSSAVRRIDPTFAKLHGTASQVAVYRYNSSTQSWVRFPI